jgi:hypothetical protein
MEKGQSPPPEFIEKARRLLQQKMEANRRWVERYGHVPQPITTENFGKRLIAVRNAIYALETRKYFGDFLRDYVLMVFSEEWWKAEMAKAEPERHPVAQWWADSTRYMSTQPLQPDGSRRGVPSGVVAAFMAFAYDLYVVSHVDGLDDLLLNRLKTTDLFQGARHELFAEATCIRAGFTIEPEDVVKALRGEQRLRYQAGREARMLDRLKKWAPSKLLDKGLRKQFGLSVKPEGHSFAAVQP